MNMRKLLACGITALSLSPLSIAVAYAAQSCEAGKGCGLQGPRGAMQDESLLQRRPFALGGLPALPANAERELPREKLILWQLDGALGEREQLLDVTDQEVKSVVLRDGLPLVRFASGRSAVPSNDSDALQTLMTRLTGKRNLRLRLIGHTDPQQLSPRSKSIYQDNYGLGMQRAEEVGAVFRERLNLKTEQLELASRGPDQPLAQGDDQRSWALNRRVEVEIWYDESMVSTPAKPQECAPGSLAQASIEPFQISVEGQPQGTGSAGSADLQRCVDVALARDLLQVRFDNLSAQPRLNVVSGARVARIGEPQQFSGYSNYLHWVKRAEVRILGKQRLFGAPKLLETVELDPLLQGSWTPAVELPDRVYYQLRVYDEKGRYDETSPQLLTVSRGILPAETEDEVAADLLAGYGGNRLERHTIPVAGGTVTINGKQVKDGQHVFVMGRPVPVDNSGSFASAQIIPRGLHSVEVAVLDDAGKGRIYRRDLRLPKNDWFTVAIADFTVGQQNTSGPARLVTGSDRYYDDKLYADGRLAFYTKGKVDDKYTITGSVDTAEAPLDSLFSNFNDKDPREFLRRMDSDTNKGWETFGDDSTLVEDAPTRGKFYAKIEDEKSHAMWGNFREQIRDTELTQVDRSLYGAQARYRSDDFTAFGERRLQVEGFAAEPGTASAREDFRGTGGSLYYLRHQDLSVGSERVRIEIRDKDSNLVLHSQDLVAGIDYEINSMQGRVILSQPLSGIASSSTLVHSGGSLSGNPAYLVVGYEYSPAFDQLDDLAYGGRTAYWVDDRVRIGVTGSMQGQTGREDQTLGGVDLLLRHSENSWVKLESAQSSGDSLDQLFSYDGGFGFAQESAGTDSKARAQRLETAFDLKDLVDGSEGNGTFYYESRDAGFSSPGRLSDLATDQIGGSYSAQLGEKTEVIIKADQTEEDQGRSRRSAEGVIAYDLSDAWQLSTGLRNDRQSYGRSYANRYIGTYAGYSNVSEYDEGERNDLVLKALYHAEEDWSLYGFTQGTLSRTGTREANNRLGIGGEYRLNERTALSGELSGGNLGVGAMAGINYDASDRTNLYFNYQLDNDRSDDGFGSRSGLGGDGRTGQVVTGARSRWTDSTSVYAEQRMQHGDQAGLIQGYGLDFAPDDRWSYGLTTEFGTFDSGSEYELKRRAMGVKIGYSSEELRYASRVELRKDKSAVQDLSVWLMRNNLSYKLNPDWRFIGKLDFSVGSSDRGDYFDGNFVESSLGYAYRPVLNDRLNLLAKYTYLADLPPPDQVSNATGTTVDYAQRSHVFAIDGIYDLTERWSIGGKYAYRLSELRMSRDSSAEWFDSRGQLIAARVDWHVVKKWDLMAEVRRRDEFAAKDSRTGMLVGAYRHFGNHFKAGVGYNFSDFSDDLTDMSYRSRGFFINAIGKY